MGYTNLPSAFPQTKLTCKSFLDASHLFTPTVDRKHAIGQELEIQGVGKFRYCKAGATGLSKGYIGAAAAPDAQAITSTAQTAYGAAAGSIKFDILQTTGNAFSDGDLVGGKLLVDDGGTAMGDIYVIKSNVWKTGDTVMTVEIADEGGLRNAIAATDDVVCFKPKCLDTVVSPTNPVSPLVGVPLVDVTAAYYYWAQYSGLVPVFVDGTDTVITGDMVTLSDSVAGTIHLNDSLADDVNVGICMFAAAVSEVCLIDMLIP